MERRNFLKTTCKLCLLGSAGFLLTQLEGCAPAAGSTIYKTEAVNNRVQIPLSLFDKSSLQYVRIKGWYFDIAVQKQQNEYSALLLQCTHQANQLTTVSDGYSCSLHGSRFDKKGNVTHGPAEEPLKKYKTSINQNNITIYI
jgi:Rieske Fe-S protein